MHIKLFFRCVVASLPPPPPLEYETEYKQIGSNNDERLVKLAVKFQAELFARGRIAVRN